MINIIGIINSNLPLSLKKKVLHHGVLPTLTYGAETRRLSKDLKRKLRSVKRRIERKTLGIHGETVN